MVKRETERFIWQYEDEVVMLVDKIESKSLIIPIIYLPSLLRAGIALKHAYKNELKQKFIQQKLPF